MSQFVRKLDGITPANTVVDTLAQIPQLHNDSPCFIGFQYWVHTAGGASAGAFSVDISWVDPTGTTRTIFGSPVSLQDGTAMFSSPVQILERLDDLTTLNIHENLIGSDDGALVSYRVMFTNPEGNDTVFFNN